MLIRQGDPVKDLKGNEGFYMKSILGGQIMHVVEGPNRGQIIFVPNNVLTPISSVTFKVSVGEALLAYGNIMYTVDAIEEDTVYLNTPGHQKVLSSDDFKDQLASGDYRVMTDTFLTAKGLVWMVDDRFFMSEMISNSIHIKQGHLEALLITFKLRTGIADDMIQIHIAEKGTKYANHLALWSFVDNPPLGITPMSEDFTEFMYSQKHIIN